MGTGGPQTKKHVFLYWKSSKTCCHNSLFLFQCLSFLMTACFMNDSFSFLTFSFFSDLSLASSTYFTVSLEVSNWFGTLALPLPWPWPLPPGPVGHICVGSLIKSANGTTKTTRMYLQQTLLHINKYSTVWCIMPCTKMYIIQLVLSVCLSYTQ